MKSQPLLVAFIAFALLWLPSFSATGAAASARPHIVLFIADDLSWHDIGPYGSKDAKTPNLDALAAQSMRFTQAVATSPTCTPSRCSIYTGLYPFRNGAHANHSLIREGVRTLPDYMKELGYRVVIAGKTHIGPREQFAFEYLKGSNVMPPGKKHVLWTDLDTGVVDQLLAEHDKSAPMCLLVCTHSPHVYWPETQDLYDPARLTLPPYLLDTSETRKARSRYLADVTWMDKQFGEVAASLAKHGYDDPAGGGTLLMFTADQGAQFPFAKWTLYDAGVRAPLIVRWPGKVKPGTTTEALASLADLLPTMTHAAGADEASRKEFDGRSVLPVLLGETTAHHDAVFATNTGDKQMNRSPARCVRTGRYKYILNLLPNDEFVTHINRGAGPDGRVYWSSWEQLAERDPYAANVVRRYGQRPAEELYDVQADPYELKNLAADPAHAQELARLRELVRDWRVRQGEDLDKVAMPEDGRSGPLPYAG